MEVAKPPTTAGKPIRCKAAVSRAAGEALVIEEIMVAPPEAHEVRIKVICTSLCQSDVTFWRLKDFPSIFPRILGHEAIGVVESVGEGVDEVVEGDVVIPTFVADCGDCADCKSTKSNLCTKLPFKLSPWMPRYESSRFTDLKGEVLYHFLSVSSFSEYTVVDIAHLVKVDASVPADRACLLSCGVSTGVGAAWRTANVEAGSTVAIFGLGSIGLAVAEGARLCSASRIIGIDLNSDKFEISKKFGVTDFVNSGELGDKSLSQVIMEMTDGGADYCFECVGSSSLVEEAYNCCRKVTRPAVAKCSSCLEEQSYVQLKSDTSSVKAFGIFVSHDTRSMLQGWGKTIVLGVAKPGSTVTFKNYDILHSGKLLIGSLFGGLKAKSDLPILLKRYMDKELRLDEFVTHEVSFNDINEAFDLLIGGKCLRCVIWVNK